MKKLFFGFISFILLFSLVACKDEEDPTVGGDVFEGLDTSIAQTLDIMVWSGDGKYHEDLGHKEFGKDEIQGQNVAAIYAVAKEFNKIFPNVKINVYAKLDDPNGGGVSWDQELENFKQEHGKYPDLWASNSVTRDLAKGLILDLSEFEDTVYYKQMNPSLLAMTNYYGFQGAIPQYILPWGVYVNRELAEENNIQTPGVDWTWAQYTNFVKKAKPEKGFCGSWDSSMRMVRWATVERQLQHNTVADRHIDINTNAFKNAIKVLPDQARTAVLSLQGTGEISTEEMVEYGNWWGYKAFADGKILTYDGDPWMLGVSNLEGANHVISGDWDIYPCPSIDGEDNYVSSVLDPLVVYNYYGKSGRAGATDAQKMMAKLAYSFAGFWQVDTRSWEARAAQTYAQINADGPTTYVSSLNDSFPVATGVAFEKQMEIWYSTPGHAPYKDEDKFPGFAEVVRLWNAGNINSFSDKAYPLTYLDSTGTTIDCVEYLTQFGNPDIVGNVTITDDTWTNTYIAGISEWNDIMNTRIETAFQNIKDSLKTYYGFTDTNF